jgi:hypothetical protein
MKEVGKAQRKQKKDVALAVATAVLKLDNPAVTGRLKALRRARRVLGVSDCLELRTLEMFEMLPPGTRRNLDPSGSVWNCTARPSPPCNSLYRTVQTVVYLL